MEPDTLRDIIRNQVKQDSGLNRLLNAIIDVLIEYHKWSDKEIYAKAIKHIQKAIAGGSQEVHGRVTTSYNPEQRID